MHLIFDTETSGKANFTLPPDHPSQPRLVQLGAFMADDQGTILADFNCIIKPDNWTIPPDVSSIHGITTEVAERLGVPLIVAMSMFNHFAKACSTRVAFNIEFDDFILTGEQLRLKRPDSFLALKRVCMKEVMTPICRIPKPQWQLDRYPPKTEADRFKWPNLQEAYQFVFKNPFEGAHNAKADIIALTGIYFWHLLSQAKKPTFTA